MSEWITGNKYLQMPDMQTNAKSFFNEMSKHGFTLNAIAGMLGNIQTESHINPGVWQNLTPFKGGYGLVQWTPYTNYSDWAGAGWQDNGDKECERIAYEFENGKQYYPTKSYPLSASEFKNSTESPAYLATAFLYNYERPKNITQPIRRTQAEYWYLFLSGEEPPPPDPDVDPPEPIESWIPIWLLFKVARRKIQC